MGGEGDGKGDALPLHCPSASITGSPAQRQARLFVEANPQTAALGNHPSSREELSEQGHSLPSVLGRGIRTTKKPLITGRCQSTAGTAAVTPKAHVVANRNDKD